MPLNLFFQKYISHQEEIVNIEVKLEEALDSDQTMDGIHKLVMSALFALTINPKSCILSYPYLTALGKVTDKLHKMLGWDNQLVDKVKKACKAQNKNIKDAGLFQYFFDTIGKTLVTRSDDPDSQRASEVAQDSYHS